MKKPMMRKVLLASARDGEDENKGGEFGKTAEKIGDATGPTAL